MAMRPTRSPARARTWSAQCPTTSTERRTPAHASASSMRARIGRPPTGSNALCVASVSGASRRATPATRMMAVTARRSGQPSRGGRAHFFLSRLHLLHQLRVRRGLDDLVELRAVVRNEADALDDDVVDEPAVVLLEHPVLDGDVGARLGDELTQHGGLVALGPVAQVLDLLAAVQLDLRDVRALEEVAEQLDELVALGLRAGRPVPAQRALGRFPEVEDVVGNLAHGDALVLRLVLQRGIVDQLEHAIHLRPELFHRRTR